MLFLWGVIMPTTGGRTFPRGRTTPTTGGRTFPRGRIGSTTGGWGFTTLPLVWDEIEGLITRLEVTAQSP